MPNFITSIIVFIKTHVVLSIVTGVVITAAVVTPIVIVENSKGNTDSTIKTSISDNSSNVEEKEESNELIKTVKEEEKKQNTKKKETNTSTNETKKEVVKKENTTKKTEENKQREENNYENARGSIDACQIDPKGEECKYEKMSSHFESNYENSSVSYDGKELFHIDTDYLEKCYDKVSCASPWLVKTYVYNESYIKALTKDEKEFVFENYSYLMNINNVVTQTEEIYNDVVAHDYINQYEQEIEEINANLNKYVQYKEDEYFPDGLDVCIESNYGQCYNSYSSLSSEGEYAKESLLKAKRDLEKVTNSLNSAKGIYRAFN